MENAIIVLSGPTACGKTALSFDLAKEFNGEIIAADSMTVYRGMDIGTDKPTLIQNSKINESDGTYLIKDVHHHLIDIVNPDEEFNVAIFQKKASEAVKKIQGKGKIPFLVGGSTMYIDSLVYGYELPKVTPDQKLRSELEKKSVQELFLDLVKLDPDAEWTIDCHNKRRLIRALEVTLKTGIPFSHQKAKTALPQNVLYLAIEKDRQTLYRCINDRVDEMIKNGFLDEVDKLHSLYDHNTAMQAAGYKQLCEHIDKNISLTEAIEKTKQVHRNYAKRQLTWLKRNQDVMWVKNKTEAQRKIREFLAQN